MPSELAMLDINRMLQTEISFCDSFTNRVDTQYGILYHNPLNPLSHDSNHAHIMDLQYPDNTLEEIKTFYRNHGLTPRVYHSFLKDELEILRPHLEWAGFTVKTHDARAFWVPPETPVALNPTVAVRRIMTIPSDVIELIHSEDAGDWTIDVLKRHVSDMRFHLLGLYEGGICVFCVSIASVKTMDGYSRVDDVLTHSRHRGKRFGTRLMEHLVNYHRSVSDNYLYLWATNPIAIRMYLRVGLTEIQTGSLSGQHPWSDR
jgi:GNAT superfamily N-acetyltransferase